jgi:hypothetical protein
MSQQQTIDKFIEALEEMIDARDDMWKQEEYHNHREFLKIEEERYNPAKELVRSYLKRVIEETLSKDIDETPWF